MAKQNSAKKTVRRKKVEAPAAAPREPAAPKKIAAMSPELEARNAELRRELDATRSQLEIDIRRCDSEMHGSGDVLDEGDDAAHRSSMSSMGSLRHHLVTRMREVDAALERLKDGGYGLCTDCQEPISVARLKANPTATRCVNCQAKAERRR